MIAGIIELTAVGLTAGLLGGMLGVGGSIVMIPALTELLGPDQHLYQSTAMIVVFFVVVPAVYQHHRARAINWNIVKALVPLALVSVVVGVELSELSLFKGAGEAHLRALFGLFLLFMAGYEVYRLFRKRRPDTSDHALAALDEPAVKRERPPWSRAAMVAVPMGLVAGLLGVGGGILLVPLQRRFLRIPIRQAIANSATVIIATAAIGATVKNYAFYKAHGSDAKPMLLAAVLIPTAIVGSLQGSRWTHRLPIRRIKLGFLALLIVAAIRLCYRAIVALAVTSS